MKFNKHSDVEGKHALLSASKYHWLGDDDEALLERLAKANAAAHGTREHAFAAEAIKLGHKLENNTQTVNYYVNECIGYKMEPEVVLFYSWYAFGTADAISFRQEADGRFVLRIFDLKTGVAKASFRQLIAYAALFCLEYNVKPMTIDYDLRIFQNDDMHLYECDPEEVAEVYDRYISANELLEKNNKEV
jgi:hypothetical protein